MLASDWQQRNSSYDFVIVGSGYGGAITAARLANADLNPKPSVCILERGREWPVGTFPDTFPRYLEEMRSDLNPLGLYDILNYRDISVIKGNGLGGTSLVNANVAIIPDEEVFKLTGWPGSLTRDSLLPYYLRARQVLAAGPHPNFAHLRKLTALEKRAQQLGTHVEALNIAVNFTIEGKNPFGAVQAKCINCGDCVTGCNVGAKNTLYMNYLPLAANGGAKIFTQTKVEWIEKLDSGGWRIHGRHYADKDSSESFTLDARNVILGAGSINTTEILLRSEMHELRVSPRLGSGFSGNGDFFAIAYNADDLLQVLGFGNHPDSPGSQLPPGPTITGVVRYNGGRLALQRFLVEDVSFPAAVVNAAQLAFPTLPGEDTDTGDEDQERRRVWLDLSQAQPYSPDGALNHTLLYLVTGFDDAKGAMEFEAPPWEPDGRMKIVWDDGGRQQIFAIINEELRRHARAIGATFIQNPIWTAFNLRRLITAHPLGGCPIGEDYLHGAVDEFGRVFAGDGSVHEGLFVADGALLPSAIGVNPFLTISALAERIAERKIEQLKGREYPQPNTAVSFSAIGPVDVVGARDAELEKLFQRCPSLGIEQILNTGERRFDIANHSIYNNAYWKGFLPKGLLLGELAARLFTGYGKRFWKEGDRYLGETLSFDNRVRLRHSLEEVTISKRANDLDPGRYIVLRYPDPPFDIFYDLLKVINENLIIYRSYTGEYPNGRRGFDGVLLRSYAFDQMSVEDHRDLFERATVPAKEDLQGVWRMDAITNANHASGIAWLRFDLKPDGRLQSRYQLMGLIEGLVVPKFAQDHFQLDDFTGFHDEIRKIDNDLLIGKWMTEIPDAFASLFPAGSAGLFQMEQAGDQARRFGFYYLLARAAEQQLPANTLLEPLLDVNLPQGVGMMFDEQMDGWYFPGQPTPPEGRSGDLTIRSRIPADGSKPANSAECHFQLTMTVRDVNEFVDGLTHEAVLKGSISFEQFEGEGPVTFPVDEKRSFFNYLIVNPATKHAEMRYHMEFRTDGGRRFTFEGRKYMQKDEPAGPRAISELIDDYTTLYAHIYEQTGDQRRELGTGYLKFHTFEDLAAMGNLTGFLHSFRITGTDNALIQGQARLKFLAFTAQFVQREYDPLAFGEERAGIAGR